MTPPSWRLATRRMGATTVYQVQDAQGRAVGPHPGLWWTSEAAAWRVALAARRALTEG